MTHRRNRTGRARGRKSRTTQAQRRRARATKSRQLAAKKRRSRARTMRAARAARVEAAHQRRMARYLESQRNPYGRYGQKWQEAGTELDTFY